MSARKFKSERHFALDVSFSDAPIACSEPPTPLAWTLNDLIVALIGVGVVVALALGVL